MSRGRRGASRVVVLERGGEQRVIHAPSIWTVVLPGASSGGPAALTGATLDLLLDMERRGLHTVLVAEDPEDLHTAVAAVSRYVLTCISALAAEARLIWGDDQVMTTTAVDERTVVDAVSALPVPLSRTWQRRLQARVGGLRRLRAVAARIQRVRPNR